MMIIYRSMHVHPGHGYFIEVMFNASTKIAEAASF